MHYVWDSAKDALNRKKHGLALSDGILAFEDPQRDEWIDRVDSITAKSELSRWGLPNQRSSLCPYPNRSRRGKAPASFSGHGKLQAR